MRRSLGRIVRQERITMRLTQEQLSGIADVHAVIISRVENGRVNINLETLERLAKAFNLRPSELLAKAGW